MSKDRIASTFERVGRDRVGGFISFITAGDPSYDISLDIMRGLRGAGVDIIELGMPFSDPMADGASIQAANLRALAGGQNMERTLRMVQEFREGDDETPIVLMGYYNPIYSYGSVAFLADAKRVGVDGLIVVDLPPEEDSELCVPCSEVGIHFIRLLAPTSDAERLEKLKERISGFVYYVSVCGITGTQRADIAEIESAIDRISGVIDLPIAVGFGLRDRDSVMMVAKSASAAVVGSAIIDRIADNLGLDSASLVREVLSYVRELTGGLDNVG